MSDLPPPISRFTPDPPPISYANPHGQVIGPKTVSGLGVAGLVCGIIALMFAWIPFIGCLTLPLAIIAGLLALAGMIVSVAGGRSGIALPVTAGVVAVVAFILPFVIPVLIGVVGQAAQRRAGTAPAVATVAAPPVRAFSVEELVAKSVADEVAADAELKGARLQVTGAVERVAKGPLGEPYVVMGGGKESGRAVQCVFDKTQSAGLANLQPGQVITVRGRFSSIGLNVQVRECELVTPEQ